MKIERRHKTVRIRRNGMDAQIDTMIAPLINKLWRYGIWTKNSCQENKPGIVWIQFWSARNAIDFLNVVARLPTNRQLEKFSFLDTMYGRISREGGFGEWVYDIIVENTGEQVGKADFNFMVSIRFPQTDLPAIMKAFEDEKHIAKRLKFDEIYP